MASLSTRQVSRKRTDKSQSPSFKNDGISPKKNHLPRSQVVQEIHDKAKEKQHVVIGSSAATGKTSLLQLLEKRLVEEEGANVIRINLNSTMTVESLLEELAEQGMVQKISHNSENSKTLGCFWMMHRMPTTENLIRSGSL
jgi:ABC-type molybdenum transport system ATPase subunit/photorepair protein PhrA